MSYQQQLPSGYQQPYGYQQQGDGYGGQQQQYGGAPGHHQGGYGAAPQGQYGAPQGGYGGQPQGGYGGAPQGSYGAPPMQQQPGYGAPQGGYGGAPMQQQGYGAPQGGYGQPQQLHAAPHMGGPPQYGAPQGHAPQRHCFLGDQFVVQGQPMVLVLTEKTVSMGTDSTVTDQTGNLMFKFDGKAMSLKDKRVMHDRSGAIIATMNQKLFGKHTWIVSRGNGGQEVCVVQQDDAGSMGAANIYIGGKAKFGVAMADYIVRMQASGKDLQITTKAGQLLAETSQSNSVMGKMMGADRYGVVVQPGVDMAWVLCVLTALDDMTFT